MPYYICTVRENKKDARRRRKLALETTDREKAKSAFTDKCRIIGFEPDFTTLREITRKEYDKMVANLLGLRAKR